MHYCPLVIERERSDIFAREDMVRYKEAREKERVCVLWVDSNIYQFPFISFTFLYSYYLRLKANFSFLGHLLVI